MNIRSSSFKWPFIGILIHTFAWGAGLLFVEPSLAEGHSYVVQLNAYKSYDNAEKFLIKMKRKGLDPFLVQSKSGRWHKVQLGPYDNFDEARQIARKLKKNERLFPVVMVALENLPRPSPEPSDPGPEKKKLPEPTATAVSTAPPPKFVSEVPSDSVDRVMARFLSWKEAWEKGQVETYLSFYSDSFEHGKNSLSAWQRSREKALKKNSSMKIEVGEIKVTQNQKNIEMSFIQDFYSSKLNDTGHKMLVWEWDGQAWNIIREIWVPVLMQ